MQDKIITYKIFLNKKNDENYKNPKDFYVNIPIYLNFNKYDEYINVDKDKSTKILQKNNFNPFYIELGFFSSIKAIIASGQTNTNIYSNTETIYEKSKIYQLTINK